MSAAATDLYLPCEARHMRGDRGRLVREDPGVQRATVAMLHSLRRTRDRNAREVARSIVEANRADTFINAIRKYQFQREAVWTERLESQFRSMAKHVASVVDDLGGLIIEKTQEAAGDVAPNEIARVDGAVQAARLRQWAAENMKRYYENEYQGMAAQIVSLLNASGYEATLRGQWVVRVLGEGGRRLGLLDLENDTKSALFRVIELAKEHGLGPRQAAKFIQQMVPAGRFVNAGPRYRAQLIARTEMMHAQRYASLQSYRSSRAGINWVIAYDGNSDEYCSARDGQVFTVADAEIEMNSDDTHPNCVLAFAPYTA